MNETEFISRYNTCLNSETYNTASQLYYATKKQSINFYLSTFICFFILLTAMVYFSQKISYSPSLDLPLVIISYFILFIFIYSICMLAIGRVSFESKFLKIVNPNLQLNIADNIEDIKKSVLGDEYLKNTLSCVDYCRENYNTNFDMPIHRGGIIDLPVELSNAHKRKNLTGTIYYSYLIKERISPIIDIIHRKRATCDTNTPALTT